MDNSEQPCVVCTQRLTLKALYNCYKKIYILVHVITHIVYKCTRTGQRQYNAQDRHVSSYMT